MKKIIGISVLILLIIGVGITMLLGIGNREVSISDLSKDVPIVSGKIVSTSTFRSDELHRGITIVVQTNLSLQEVVKYYSDEFTKRDIKSGNIPLFHGNARDIENSTEANTNAETRNHLQIGVFIRTESQATIVTIEVLGNSMFFLPS